MISFAEAIKDAKALAGEDDYFRCPAVWEAVAAIHGVVIGQEAANDSGVFTQHERIRFGEKNVHLCNAEIILAKTPKGHWLMETSYMIHYQGSGAYPSVWNRVGYTTREEAVDAGIDKLIGVCNRLFTDREHGYHAPAMQIKLELERYRTSTKQLALF